jgi:hypothetical protein
MHRGIRLARRAAGGSALSLLGLRMSSVTLALQRCRPQLVTHVRGLERYRHLLGDVSCVMQGGVASIGRWLQLFVEALAALGSSARATPRSSHLSVFPDSQDPLGAYIAGGMYAPSTCPIAEV